MQTDRPSAVTVTFVTACVALFFVGIIPMDAEAQVPQLNVYFYSATGPDTICPYCDPYHPGPDYNLTLYFVLTGADAYVSAIEFSVSYAWTTWMADVHNATLFLGSSPDGVAMTWSTPQDGYSPLLVMAANVTHHAFCNYEALQIAVVEPHSVTGKLRAVRWPDNSTIDLAGGEAGICARTIPVEARTWGAVKSLYR